MENQGLDGKIILRGILKKSVDKTWDGLSWLGIRTIINAVMILPVT